MNALLFGPPGSGKGTQATALAEALAVPHVATGDIFRKNLKEGTDLGKLAKSYMEKGGLVPDSVTCDMVAARLSESDCGLGVREMAAAPRGVLLDGFPRSTPQAEWLLGWLDDRGHRIDHVVNLLVPDAVVIERISGRRTCLGCGATYHVTYAPPKVAGTCDRCGGEVVQRKDDAEDVVRDRLATYQQQTAPVLGVLRDAGTTIHDVDGLGTVDEIRSRIFGALGL
ncbi:MAG: adenylate kinase [Myxococcota bacterium]